MSAPGQNARQSATASVTNKNIDLGAMAMSVMSGFGAPTDLPQRPAKGNTTGRDVNIRLNTWNVQEWPSKPVYQYDVLIGSGAEKAGTVKAMWNSRAVQEKVGPSKGFIFDGSKIAWGPVKNTQELRIDVDLNAEEGRTGGSAANQKRVVIKFTKQVDFAAMDAWLNRRASFDNGVLEAINFLDHLMRETPSKKLVSIKRNFFKAGETRVDLGGGVQAAKGVYASIRPALVAPNKAGLSVNVDVANTTFWKSGPLLQAAGAVLGATNPDQLAQRLGASGAPTAQIRIEQLKPFRGVNVMTTHMKENNRTYKIAGFSSKTARTHKFSYTNRQTNQTSEVTLEQYFRTQWNMPLRYPNLPIVQMTKTIKTADGKTSFVFLPIEVCNIRDDERYGMKLSDVQTSNMIKFAVTLPRERWQSIERGLGFLDWQNDTMLRNYGLKINTAPTTVKGRLLPNPKVTFGGNKSVDPKTTGRWDLRGQRFFESGQPLKAWGVLLVQGRGAMDNTTAQNFCKVFVQIYKGHGGAVANDQPTIMTAGNDVANSLNELFQKVGQANQMKPQIFFVMVPSRDSGVYLRIKKNCECRFGLVSQVLQVSKAAAAQPQYCSNVAMKVNAKLGGSTARAIGLAPGPDKNWFKVPTMVIGADVSHGGAGTMTPSVAAMTISKDRLGIKFMAAVQTNGVRVEIITKDNIHKMLSENIDGWTKTVANGNAPQHVIYFRDGVSEGQYAHVLNQEVADMRALFKSKGANPKFTVIVATKRHHVRFFPDQSSGDRNGNPQPGTLIETGVTHPFEHDFYLCSHSAIKGTARPVHYHVILDEAKMDNTTLQNMIYESSYQYVRSTTPISLPPAVYYAHLATNRGIAHIDQVLHSDSGSLTGGAQRQPDEIKPILPMQPGVKTAMWYV